MSFTHSVIGRNTQENRKWLEGIGYEPYSLKGNSKLLFAYLNFLKVPIYVNEHKAPKSHKSLSSDFINCIHSDELFRAVTTMREDTANGQYWVFDEDFDKYKKGDFVMGGFHRCSCYCHKATLDELISHFNTTC